MNNKLNIKTANKTILLVCVALLWLALFTGMGNSHDPEHYGPSIASWLFFQWSEDPEKSGHGWMVAIASLWLLWKKRKEIKSASSGSGSGHMIWFIVLSLTAYWAGYRTQQPRLGILALISLLWAIPFYLHGRTIAKLILFPCAYLVFAMPMQFLEFMTFPLRRISSFIAVSLLNGISINTTIQGTAIQSSTMQGFSFDVADACSGLQYLVVLTALTALYAHLSQKTNFKKWVLFLCAVPIAIIANSMRIVIIAIAASIAGQEIAIKIYHDFSGFIVFAVAVLLMMSASGLINKFPIKLEKREQPSQ